MTSEQMMKSSLLLVILEMQTKTTKRDVTIHPSKWLKLDMIQDVEQPGSLTFLVAQLLWGKVLTESEKDKYILTI